MTRAEEYAKRVKMATAARMREETEVDDLRRLAAELRQVLALVVDDERKFVEVYRTAADDSIAICNFCEESHRDEYQIEHKPKCPIEQARAALVLSDEDKALARCGGGGEEVGE